MNQRTFLIIFILSFIGCGGNKKEENDEVLIDKRLGGNFEIKEFKGFNGKTALSADGNLISFISTKNKKFQSFVLRNYEIGAEPVTPTLLISGGVNDPDKSGAAMSEIQAWVSPDASAVFVALVGVSRKFLYRVNADGSSLTKVLDYKGHISSLVFSPDSTILSITEQNYEANSVYLLSLSSDTPKKINIEGAERSLFFFEDVPPSYSIGLTRVVEEKRDLIKLAFSSNFENEDLSKFESIKELPTTVQISDITLIHGNVLFLDRNTSEKPLVLTRGNAKSLLVNEDERKKVSVVAKNSLKKMSLTGADAALSRDDIGYEILSISSAPKQEIGVYLTNNSYRCYDSKKDLDQVFGTTLVFFNLAEKTPYEWLLPKQKKSDLKWSLTSSPCIIDFDSDLIDSNLRDVKINRAATSTKFRVVYTSRVEENSGIFILDRTDGVTTIKKVKND